MSFSTRLPKNICPFIPAITNVHLIKNAFCPFRKICERQQRTRCKAQTNALAWI